MLHIETEHMIKNIEKKHELEKINLQQKIDALTTILMAEPSNVHRYYFMPVSISNPLFKKSCQPTVSVFFISNNNSFLFLLNNP